MGRSSVANNTEKKQEEDVRRAQSRISTPSSSSVSPGATLAPSCHAGFDPSFALERKRTTRRHPLPTTHTPGEPNPGIFSPALPCVPPSRCWHPSSVAGSLSVSSTTPRRTALTPPWRTTISRTLNPGRTSSSTPCHSRRTSIVIKTVRFYSLYCFRSVIAPFTALRGS